MVRGKSNIVQVFDVNSGSVEQEKDYSSIFDSPIKGLHSIKTNSKANSVEGSLSGVKHVMVDQEGTCIIDSLAKKSTPKGDNVFKLKGDNVVKTCLSESTKYLQVCSRDMTLQLWDLNASKQGVSPMWQARNLPDDELDIKVPIFDKGVVECDPGVGRVLATCTGYGEIRHYDIRAQRRAVSNVSVTKDLLLLSHIAQSVINEHHLYVITQEGHPIVVDRRVNCRVVRTMPGSKGSVRDIKLISKNGVELLMTGGCDRHIRLFDQTQEVQKECCIGSAYLKQKINCMLITDPLE